MRLRLFICVALSWVCGYGQTPSFEVASVKAASPDARAIECSTSPGLWRCLNVPLGFVMTQAWEFQAYQFPPNHPCCRDRFDFTAKMPAGTTMEQFRKMLQALLGERFGLKWHFESREMTVDDLTVAEKGSRLKPGTGGEGISPWAPTPYNIGKDGFPEFPEGRSGVAGMGGNYRWRAYSVTADEIAKMLSFYQGRPVIDATGLRGRYDIDLRWSIGRVAEMTDEPANGPSLQKAVQDQLGLKLTSQKGQGEIVVIDHVEKTPREN